MLYPPAFPEAFASSNLSHPSLHQHALRFACQELLLAEGGVNTFHIVDPMGDLGATYTPEVQRFRAGSYRTCILTSCCLLWEAAFGLIILVGRSKVTTHTVIQLISPYRPSLALNGGGFPDGFSCRHSNPFRYIVRGASHQPHSAWQARPRRDRQEHAGYSRQIPEYTQLCDFVSHDNVLYHT